MIVALTVLFAEALDQNGCSCVRLGKDASVEAALQYRTFDEIKLLQTDSVTIVVISTLYGGIHQVELPWLSETKARAAIPYALEEQLAPKLSSLHFAFDRAHHQNNRYLVAVMDKSFLATLMSRLQEANVEFDEITMDWFALSPNEACLTPTNLLVRDDTYLGSLSFELASVYVKSIPDSVTRWTFTDSSESLQWKSTTTVDSPFALWVAQRLQQLPRLNLCQGELRHGRHKQGLNRKWFILSLSSIGLWLLSILVFNVMNLVRLNHQIYSIDQDIAVVYKKFFPNAQTVISPRFRISQLLKEGHATAGSVVLWQLLDKLDGSINLSDLTVQQLEYKNRVLSVTLKGRDFNVLESFGERLKQEGIHVMQTQAASQDKDVTAVMEMRL